MKNVRRSVVAAVIASCAIGTLSMAGPASAASVTGWVGPAGSNFLDTSTIVNSPQLYAESKIYSTVGATAAPGKLGVRPRLFKSGALCEAVDYSYNFYPETTWTARTTATCGTGSYNSHGFVAVWNDSKAAYDQYLTFPSNPLNWTAPAARSAKSQAAISDADRRGGTNASGKTFGSASAAAASPDLILAIGTNGQVGYVRSAQLDLAPGTSPDAASKSKPASRTIPLVQSDGRTEIGSFQVN